MLKDKVQFQKGLSLRAFLDSYGSESQCEHVLLRIRWPHGLDCSASFCRLRSRRLLQRNRCKRQVSLLAGTIFQSTKLPLTTCFLAIYLLVQAKKEIPALELGRQLGVNNNIAWLLKHQLLQAMRERDLGRKLCGTVQIDDARGWREAGRQARSGLGKQEPPGDCGAGHRRHPAAGRAPAESSGKVPQGGTGSLGGGASQAGDSSTVGNRK